MDGCQPKTTHEQRNGTPDPARSSVSQSVGGLVPCDSSQSRAIPRQTPPFIKFSKREWSLSGARYAQYNNAPGPYRAAPLHHSIQNLSFSLACFEWHFKLCSRRINTPHGRWLYKLEAAATVVLYLRRFVYDHIPI